MRGSNCALTYLSHLRYCCPNLSGRSRRQSGARLAVLPTQAQPADLNATHKRQAQNWKSVVLKDKEKQSLLKKSLFMRLLPIRNICLLNYLITFLPQVTSKALCITEHCLVFQAAIFNNAVLKNRSLKIDASFRAMECYLCQPVVAAFMNSFLQKEVNCQET